MAFSSFEQQLKSPVCHGKRIQTQHWAPSQPYHLDEALLLTPHLNWLLPSAWPTHLFFVKQELFLLAEFSPPSMTALESSIAQLRVVFGGRMWSWSDLRLEGNGACAMGVNDIWLCGQCSRLTLYVIVTRREFCSWETKPTWTLSISACVLCHVKYCSL